MGAEKAQILAACRYGIHGREGEAFGIGVAEMVKAGCITFAPAEGGPAEIVNHEALLYRDDDEAIEKITAVLDQRALRGELIDHLRNQAKHFSPEAFMTGLREAVTTFFTRLARLRLAYHGELVRRHVETNYVRRCRTATAALTLESQGTSLCETVES